MLHASILFENTGRKKMDEKSIIYWAGFFDGDGHVELAYRTPTQYSHYGTYSFSVWINQGTENPEELFVELLKAFGGGIITNDTKHPHHQRWYISGDKGRCFLETIVPYLRIKKRTAELGIELQQAMHRGSKPLTEEEIHFRDHILEEYYSLINKPIRVLKFGRDFRQASIP